MFSTEDWRTLTLLVQGVSVLSLVTLAVVVGVAMYERRYMKKKGMGLSPVVGFVRPTDRTRLEILAFERDSSLSSLVREGLNLYLESIGQKRLTPMRTAGVPAEDEQ